MCPAPIHCVDAVIILGETFVLIQRHAPPWGLALPGGKIEADETPIQAVVREVREETGLMFESLGTLGTYASPGRDPRGNFASTVFFGTASGLVRAESGKTSVILLGLADFRARRDGFFADHASIIDEYLANMRVA